MYCWEGYNISIYTIYVARFRFNGVLNNYFWFTLLVFIMDTTSKEKLSSFNLVKPELIVEKVFLWDTTMEHSWVIIGVKRELKQY